MKYYKAHKQRGFVILFAVTLSAILLAIALGVGNVAENEVRFGTSARNTSNALAAADTGIECALFYDRSSAALNAFTGTASMSCSGSAITPLASGSYWTFVVPPQGAVRSCSKVSVDKTDPLKTIIISKGYNTGDATCNSTDPNRVERELKVTY